MGTKGFSSITSHPGKVLEQLIMKSFPNTFEGDWA